MFKYGLQACSQGERCFIYATWLWYILRNLFYAKLTQTLPYRSFQKECPTALTSYEVDSCLNFVQLVWLFSCTKICLMTIICAGLCTNTSCSYRHVNVNPNASVCEGFLKGYCVDGDEVYAIFHKRGTFILMSLFPSFLCTNYNF